MPPAFEDRSQLGDVPLPCAFNNCIANSAQARAKRVPSKAANFSALKKQIIFHRVHCCSHAITQRLVADALPNPCLLDTYDLNIQPSSTTSSDVITLHGTPYQISHKWLPQLKSAHCCS